MPDNPPTGVAAKDFRETAAAFLAENPDIELVEVFVTDLNGLARGKLVPAPGLAKLADGGLRMPVSTLGLDVFGVDVPENAIAIECGDPDGPLVPVASSLARMPWSDPPAAQLQCMQAEPDGTIAAYDPRGALARVAARAAERGLSPVMALELEFYLVDAARPEPPLCPASGARLSRSQMYDMGVMGAFGPVLSEIRAAAEATGAPADGALCEFGPGQFEMNLRHAADPLAAADHMIALKRAIRGVARRHGMDASFMPKPYGDQAGSGQHVHLSLLDAAGANVFDGGTGMNAALGHALAGCLATMGECMLIFSPHQNGYRRFAPGSYAPTTAAWGLDNRSVALRLPEVAGPGARLEHRVAGSDANPYLLAAAVLAGALAGLDGQAPPPPPVAAEAGPADGLPLPRDWADAEAAFADSAFVADWLGPELRRILAGQKRQERATMMARVPDVEYEAYLRVV